MGLQVKTYACIAELVCFVCHTVLVLVVNKEGILNKEC